MYAISTLLLLLAGKPSRVPKVTSISPQSLNSFWNFAWYANRRCTGHATMSIQRGNDRLIPVHAPFLVLAIARNQKSLSNIVINCVGRKFENSLQTALKESLVLFPVDELKAEQSLIIEKIVARRDVFGKLPTGHGKSLTFQLLPGVLSCLKA